MNKKAIGIDLGSTLSEVAVIEAGKPTVIANEDGSYTTPSVVCFKDNTPKVGNAAKRQMVVFPKETVNLIKRFMGSTYDEVQDAIKHIQYDVVNDNGQPRVLINGRKYSPEEISSMILTKMKKTAEDYLGCNVSDAVITVPAFFSDAAKSATAKMTNGKTVNVWDETEKRLKDLNIKVAAKYETPSGGLHLILNNKNNRNLRDFYSGLKDFDGGKNLGVNATVHPSEDVKMILYSNVETEGY